MRGEWRLRGVSWPDKWRQALPTAFPCSGRIRPSRRRTQKSMEQALKMAFF